MDLSGWVAAIQESRKAGLLHRGLKILNLVNTARGAATTVLLAASAVGGATAIQQATERAAGPDRAEHSGAPRQPGTGGRFAPSPSPSRSPITPASIRADAEARLQLALQQAAAAVDDLKKISVLPAARLDQLVSDTKTKLQQRADLAMTQIAGLAGAPTTTGAPRSDAPSAPVATFSIITLDAIVRLAAADLNGIVTQATRVATTPPTPPPPPPTPVPTAAPASPVPATPAPTPRPTLPPASHSPSPSPRR